MKIPAHNFLSGLFSINPSLLPFQLQLTFYFISFVREVCNFLSSVSLQQKFKGTDGPVLQLSIGQGVCTFPSSVSPQQKFEETDGPDLQLSFIWQAKENASSRHEGGLFQKIQREKRPVVQFWLLFIYFFSPPLSLPFVNWASKEGYLFHLRFSLWSSDLSLFHFCGLFPFFVFQPPLIWTLFSYSNYLTFSPQEMRGPSLWKQGHRCLSIYFC